MKEKEKNKSKGEEYIRIHTPVKYKNWDRAGKYLSKCLNKMKENGEMWGNRCPKCKIKFFPPIITCGFCKIRIGDVPENWIKFGNKGTILSFFTPETKARDRSTGKLAGTGQTMAYIRIDGGDEYTIVAYVIENIEKIKLHKGMRVEAIWKSKAERQARMSDILYYVPVKDE